MAILILSFFIFMNCVGFLLMYMDKQRAKKRKWRISERNLWVVSFCFGAIGTTVGMIIFRHKSKHPAFSLGLPILAAIQVFITFQMFY